MASVKNQIKDRTTFWIGSDLNSRKTVNKRTRSTHQRIEDYRAGKPTKVKSLK